MVCWGEEECEPVRRCPLTGSWFRLAGLSLGVGTVSLSGSQSPPLLRGRGPVGAFLAGAPWLVEGCPAPDCMKSEFLVLPVGALGGLSSIWLAEAPAVAQTHLPCSFLGSCEH